MRERVAQEPIEDAPVPRLAERTWDAIVVGAGPAGSVTARELARRGVSVLLVERKAWPRAKVCGACLSSGALEILRRVGLGGLPDALGGVRAHELALAGWGTRARVRLPGTMVVSRAAFDAALVRAAVAEGVTFVAGTRARAEPLDRGGRRLSLTSHRESTSARCRVVIAADGLGGGLLGEATASRRAVESGDSRVGLGCVFEAPSAYRAGRIHMAVGRGGYVGLVRLEDGRLNVAAAVDPALLRALGGPDPAVRAILREAGLPALPPEPEDGWTGTPGLTRRPERPGAERLLAVGDACGYVEPFTGEGIAWALAGAVALAPIAAEAVHAWRPELLDRWTETRARHADRGQRLCRGVSWTLRRPLLSWMALGAVARMPGLATPFVARAARVPA